MDYATFLERKRITVQSSGFEPKTINEKLFDFQRDIVRWACKKGKAAIFADCGLGKTPMQLEWARLVSDYCGRGGAWAAGASVLILAPLAVSRQTKREGKKFGVPVTICRTQDDVRQGVNITNYEMLEHFDAEAFAGIVLDESSILKSHTGKTRTAIIEAFARTPYKLCCTATPAPNDHMELGNHAEFLGTMTREEMLAMFFVHDGGETSKWRLKGHGERMFWEWVASWAVVLRHPHDLGYADKGFRLPELAVEKHIVRADVEAVGTLFAMPAESLVEQGRARKSTIEERVRLCAEMVNDSDEPWLVWCDLNDESAAIARAIPGAVEVKGADSTAHKEDAMIGFSDGKYRVLVTKPSIAGFGMNWQHCSNMAFVGLSHSYEQYYQAIRRCWRFGQRKNVNAHVIVSDIETAVVENVMRKEKDAVVMIENMVEHTKNITSAEIHGTQRNEAEYKTQDVSGDGWRLMLGDCVERVRELPDESVHFSIFSPPFASLYTYSNSERDMGNSKTDEEFNTHFQFLIAELFRVLKQGRLVSFHCMNLPTSKERNGFIGIRDFRGDLIRYFQSAGFIYHSEVVIWKDPVTAMQRTKALGLLHKQIVKDSCMSRQGIPDYLVTMRKPGENAERVSGGFNHYQGDDTAMLNAPVHGNARDSINVWQRYASPVWMDINPSDTLQYRAARENNDERHICPLQLQVIHRALQLWTNHGDLVLSPFAGIGSEGYESVKTGRTFVGIELKESYFKQAVKNLKHAESVKHGDLFESAAGE